jgi:GNAT superfamily N-acetyltransferase
MICHVRYSGMLLRPATPEDALAVAQVHVRSWQSAYKTLLPDDYLNGLSAEDRAQRYDFSNPDPLSFQTIVLEHDESIAGFATTSRSRDEQLPDFGELCALYVDPSKWGLGYGVALVKEARAQLLSLGFTDALLWVLRGNSRAERFYRTDGWMADEIERTDSVWGAAVEELRYVRELP